MVMWQGAAKAKYNSWKKFRLCCGGGFRIMLQRCGSKEKTIFPETANAASGAQTSSNSDVARADAASPQTEVVSKTNPSLETMTHQKWFVPPAALLPLIQLTDLAFLPTATYVLGNWAGAVPELLLTVLLCSVLGELGRCRSPRLQASMIFL